MLATALASPLMAQEVVQEPRASGFNYPNSNYLTGGYGQRTPWNADRYARLPNGGYVAVGPGHVVVGPGVGVVAKLVPYAPYGGPYGAYAYDPY